MFPFRWLWSVTKKKDKVKIIVGMILACFTSSLVIVNAEIVKQLIDQVIVPKDPTKLFYFLGLLLGAAVLRIGLRYYMIFLMEPAGLDTQSTTRQRLFEVMQFQESSFFDHMRTGDLMTRMTADTEWCRHFLAFLSRQTVDLLTLFILTLIMFLYTNWKLTVCLVAFMPLLLIVAKIYSKKVHPQFANMRERLSDMNTAAQENIAGNRVIKAFAQEEAEKAKFDDRNEEYRKINLLINRMWLTAYPILDIASNSLTWVTIFIGGLFIINGSLTAGGLSVFSGLAWALASPIQNMGGLINDIQRFTTCTEKIMEVYYGRPLIVNRPDAHSHPDPRGNISFDHVSFSFRSTKVLEDVSFSVKAGQTLAIMGSTGSGKTTIINLLARFYDPQAGIVKLDGDDVRFWKLEELRSSIGTATQDVFLFSDSIENNIAFGDPDMTSEQAQDFARRAGVDEFAAKMPEGYDTIVGERGVGLSGGQKQRIALARAMAMKPAVLVLDDTTSALDMETEMAIQEQLRELPYECTKIIIAQRISSVKDADQILVLRDGKISEQGTHEELLKQKGYYWETYAVQNDLPLEKPADSATKEGGC